MDQQTAAAAVTERAAYEDDGFEDFRAHVARTLAAATAGGERLFVTRPAPLFSAYLEAAPFGQRQARNCRACCHFVERFGGLVTIRDDGTLRSALWDPSGAPTAYADAARTLARAVEHLPVVGVFLSDERVLGTLVQGAQKCAPFGVWTHLSAPTDLRVRVTARGVATTYKLDRWD